MPQIDPHIMARAVAELGRDSNLFIAGFRIQVRYLLGEFHANPSLLNRAWAKPSIRKRYKTIQRKSNLA